jgi:hypothetical protein
MTRILSNSGNQNCRFLNKAADLTVDTLWKGMPQFSRRNTHSNATSTHTIYLLLFSRTDSKIALETIANSMAIVANKKILGEVPFFG